ncbi:uncharacterized protein PGTG_11243 [Puccinia graminis f. sp. tritici CRL 75-36-700-3]|uniref:DNA-(apurinic or apyrimidinic site) lyase n=1 Tax=Puccinia graminis f. sp. tritici (strain CRL 75-36-700-3 / race SCCL) TaxID=418459 RepID=E3KL99_PUCGT|nr:uncharacterized protein PGTG_11243 [Puccinia graminis f. sp. tritici CRL 75-36-700-3]EFP85074.2 hypothetical protein PGTG_11243 [Puccinia graminis f. sp. tritici CRL 75-36-700-3]
MLESDDKRPSTSSPLSSFSSTGDEDKHDKGIESESELIVPVRFFPISRAELSLPAVLKCGQTFRWNRSQLILKLPSTSDQQTHHGHHEDRKPEPDDLHPSPSVALQEWSMAWIDRTVVLRQDDQGIYYTALYRPSHIEEYDKDCKLNTTYDLLKAYFVLDVSLVNLYHDWSERDPVFSNKVASGEWDGLRVVRQDSWETMISFICSANNNIPRISLMLNRLCATFGDPMPCPPLGITLPSMLERQNVVAHDPSSPRLEFFSFPSPRRLSQPDVIDKLKLLGFGYRASYVYKTSIKLCEIASEAQKENRWPGFLDPDCQESTDKHNKQEEGEEEEEKPALLKKSSFEPQDFLDFLASQSYEQAHSKLVNQFPGVGPKVGDCICLFGLGFVHVVPVDIHIYKIALRDYQLDLNSSTTTKKNPANRDRSVGAKNKKESELDRSSSVRTKPSPSPSSSKASPSKKKKKKSLDLPSQVPSNLSPSNKRKSSNPTSSAPPALTRPNYLKIQQFFVSTWGPWAGWAQQILFLADLTKAPT